MADGDWTPDRWGMRDGRVSATLALAPHGDGGFAWQWTVQVDTTVGPVVRDWGCGRYRDRAAEDGLAAFRSVVASYREGSDT